MSKLQEGMGTLFSMLANERKRARPMTLAFPHGDAPEGTMLVRTLRAFEGLSRDFHFVVEAVSDNRGIALKDVQGKMVTVSVQLNNATGAGDARHFNGYVFEFKRVGSDNSYATYELVLKPWLAFLGMGRDNYLFHGLDALKQTEDVFADYAAVVDWQPSISGTPTSVTDACQWDESDYNYLHRRWEDQGWHYTYEHRADGHTLILSDDSTAAQPIPGDDPAVPWASGAEMGDDTVIGNWTALRDSAPARVSLASFDFKKPQPVVVQADTANQQGGVLPVEDYRYEGVYGFKTAAEGDALAQRRMLEIEARAKHFRASSGNRALRPGRWFTLDGAPQGDDKEADFLIVDVEHTATNSLGTGEGAAAFHYTNTIACSRKSVPWLPGRGWNSKQPNISAPQTAIVTGPKGEEIHTDKYGRVRVQFHWDRVGQYDEKSSAWIRVSSSWTGKGYGFVAIPRVGQEVVVQFLDGNPDRPLITGCVFNEHNMPPFGLPGGAHKTGLQTRSSPGAGGLCEMVIHDEAGKELINILSHKDMVRTVLNNDSTVVKGPQQTVAVTTGTQTTTVHGTVQTTSETDAILSTAQTACEITANTQHIKLTAATEIELTVGGSTLRMSADGTITLEGVHITVKGSGQVDVNP